jgi:hypothetical protein
MAALKVLVVVMGVLIVAGIGAIVWGIATRLDLSRPRFADGRIELPAGAKVVDMAASGERLVLRVALPDAGERLIVVDLSRVRQLGALELVRP